MFVRRNQTTLNSKIDLSRSCNKTEMSIKKSINKPTSPRAARFSKHINSIKCKYNV